MLIKAEKKSINNTILQNNLYLNINKLYFIKK